MRRLCAIALCLLVVLTAAAFAADTTLVYFENNSSNLTLTLADGTMVKGAGLSLGMSLPAGTTVATRKGDFVELRLPNRSIIKIQEDTTFTIVSIQKQNNAAENRFKIETGRIRAVAAKVAGDRYTIQTKNAACGVRGTDLGMEVDLDPATGLPLPAKAFVFSGLIDFLKLDDAGNTLAAIQIAAGQWADAAAALFEALTMDQAMLERFRNGLDFKKLDPNQVPGQTSASTENGNATGANDTQGGSAQTPDWLKALGSLIGLKIGALTIGNDTYAMAVLSPKFNFDDFKLSLYLPVIYRTNLFDPGDWYHPYGNNEWSFGTDASFGDNVWLRLGDIAYDLVLKIKGLEIGDRLDPFFLKLGNLDTFTIGHGLIMRDYANDSDFPAVRRIGLNLGVDTGGFGFELFSNDLGEVFRAEPEIAGTRIFFRPGYPFMLAIGLSFVTDLDPARDLPNLGDPIFFSGGLDLDFPLVRDPSFNLTLFADAALMLPYFRSAVPGAPSLPAGFAFDAIVYGPAGAQSFKNFGAAAGLIGNVSLFEWRLEARYSTGKFKPALYNSGYDRVKTDYVNEVIAYLKNPNDPANQTNTFGIYGEGKFTIDKVFSVTLGYLCPLAFTSTGVGYGTDDFFQIKFSLEPKVIPVVGIFGSIAYERTKFISGFSGGLPQLFDKNTVVRATIGYPVTEGLSIIFIYTTTQLIDPNTGVASLAQSFTFETDIAF